MSDWGIKITKTNHDSDDADKYMRMHSKYPVLKLAKKGSGTLSKGSGNDSVTVEIEHNLGYKPICFVDGQWYDDSASSVTSEYSRWNRWIYRGVQTADFYNYYADTTKLYIVLNMSHLNNADALDFDYTYHIFYDEDEL